MSWVLNAYPGYEVRFYPTCIALILIRIYHTHPALHLNCSVIKMVVTLV